MKNLSLKLGISLLFFLSFLSFSSLKVEALVENDYIYKMKLYENGADVYFKKIDDNFESITFKGKGLSITEDKYYLKKGFNDIYFLDNFKIGEKVSIYVNYYSKTLIPKPITDSDGTIYYLDSKNEKFYIDENGDTYKLLVNSEECIVSNEEFFEQEECQKPQTRKNYFEDNNLYSIKKHKKLIDTITLKDTTPPDMFIYPEEITTRDILLFVDTEEKSKVTIFYNGKKIKLKDKFAKEHIADLPILKKGGKIKIISADKAGNKSTKIMTVKGPKGVKLSMKNKFATIKGKISGKVTKSEFLDEVKVKIHGKTYSSYVEDGKFSIKIPKKIKKPTKVTVTLIDNYNNTVLDKKTITLYQYDYFKIGMSTTQINNSYLGKPDRVYSYYTSKNFYETWYYYNNNLELDFKNGKLESVFSY